tara:strand:- start:17094 stop:17858 length:765 start_codon:yes stop_codon:yes gene_type:complete
LKINVKKSLGQNFIFDKNILIKISSFIKSNKDTTIIEVGPGPGTLTTYLQQKSFKKLLLIEKDDRLIDNLNNEFQEKNIKIIHHDALNYNYQQSENNNSIIVGNLPFNIATELLYIWTKIDNWPPVQTKMVLMFQKEVANRIIAIPNNKSYGKLSVVMQSRYKIKKLLDIPAKVFSPPPKVDGTVLEFIPHNEFNSVHIDKIDQIAKIAFSQRRKKIKNNLKDYLSILDRLEIDVNLRAENLSVENYYSIARLT